MEKMSEEAYQKASELVENIIQSKYTDIKDVIENSFQDIPYQFKRQYYSHMNVLFLNVLFNRLNEFNNSEEVEKIALESRNIIYHILGDLPLYYKK